MQKDTAKTEKPKQAPSGTESEQIYLEPLEEGTEPTLSGEAGLTTASAKAAGTKGYVDKELHAGFVSKQTGFGH